MKAISKAHLPQLHLNGVVELTEARLQMHCLTVRVVEVDGALLVLMFVHVTKMSAQLQ